ncbi:protein mono-ADP-ribosyltransferase PARP4 isoform X4 [Hemicordylus capensis]|uniref:protein mono-ADP-ribosyltransferase PARP4 isoform X3 n=1 Tax=Hemicordylus capensis TaxID=884348 RepID=UPI002304B6FF|nr:protein mono-ADP-ribosyltransferase PARP4 isoform X3 [Hemicordylus capensis]XP_053163692.1 protein mono-ADP-ribosyltransferase PARP4 isoform X4 [Hemicordylus capensis]
MIVKVFANCAFFLKLKKLTIQEKNRLKCCIKENGGQIKFVLNHECTHVVTDDDDALSSIHLKTIQKYQLPVVDADFIWNSIEKGRLLPTDNNEPPQTPECITVTDVEISPVCEDNNRTIKKSVGENGKRETNDSSNIGGLRWFSENDKNIPYFPEDFEVAKYDVLKKGKHAGYVVVELQCSQQHCDYPFRLCVHYSESAKDQDHKQFIPAKTSEEARRTYVVCIEHLKNLDFRLRKDFPNNAEYLASVKLQEVLVEEAISSSTLSEEVAVFVELIWSEALGHLDHLLAKPVTSISLNDVSKAEGILLRVKKALDEMKSAEELTTMILEFYKTIPHRSGLDYDVSKKLLSDKQDLCQLIRDMLNIRETNMSVPNLSSLSKYRALKCKIDVLDEYTEEFHNVKQQLVQNKDSGNPIEVLQIYKVGRLRETANFESCLGNVQSLFHASPPRNFVGILSRGLLLPKIVVEEHGLERTDSGNLGSGIYFSDAISTSIKYSQKSQTDGSRLLLICDVALGTSYEQIWTDESLTTAPSGYQSVHGVSKEKEHYSAFEADEFVVYRTSQVKIQYVAKVCLEEEKVKEFNPVIQTDVEDQVPFSKPQSQPEVCEIPSKNLLSDITAGLLDKSGNPIPLKDVHIKGRIIDFVAEVVVFQTYENQTGSPIEAKYVFRLDDTAAVCGFEAFIKGKHIIGEVKEKEKAHQEYREAVSRGDGAYLMDQDAPDIFTVSVGNLPPSTKVLIKITYITELRYENGCLSFHLPAAVAPWQQDKALNENTQESVRTVSIKQVGTKPGEFSLEMSVEMPFIIKHISSWTHQLEIKKTDCKAVVRTVENSSLDISGFAIEILIGNEHLPRMWVEKHPEKESEACMLIFQPEFAAPLDPLSTSGETVICLDCSNSMAGSEIQQAKQIALCALDSCHSTTRLSVIKFGTNFIEFPSSPDDFTTDCAALKAFVKSAKATMGYSDLWKTLRYLNLLYTSKGRRNILLISDGHIQNEGLTLQMVKENAQHTRIFACGVGPTANRHMLRSLSQYGAGAFEYFDVKSKYNWKRKIENQTTRMFSPGCSGVSIKWQQFDTSAPELTYAPAQIQSLFNHERLLIYGFISHCTQATLNALIDNQELQTVVSTTELQKTRGTMIHKLAARAFIRDYEEGMLDENETEHEMKKQMLTSLIIKLSLENSIVTQFTSFVAIEKRDANEDQIADTLNILELVAKENVDILPYMQYQLPTETTEYLLREFNGVSQKASNMKYDLCSDSISTLGFKQMLSCPPKLLAASRAMDLSSPSSDASISDFDADMGFLFGSSPEESYKASVSGTETQAGFTGFGFAPKEMSKASAPGTGAIAYDFALNLTCAPAQISKKKLSIFSEQPHFLHPSNGESDSRIPLPTLPPPPPPPLASEEVPPFMPLLPPPPPPPPLASEEVPPFMPLLGEQSSLPPTGHAAGSFEELRACLLKRLSPQSPQTSRALLPTLGKDDGEKEMPKMPPGSPMLDAPMLMAQSSDASISGSKAEIGFLFGSVPKKSYKASVSGTETQAGFTGFGFAPKEMSKVSAPGTGAIAYDYARNLARARAQISKNKMSIFSEQPHFLHPSDEESDSMIPLPTLPPPAAAKAKAKPAAKPPGAALASEEVPPFMYLQGKLSSLPPTGHAAGSFKALRACPRAPQKSRALLPTLGKDDGEKEMPKSSDASISGSKAEIGFLFGSAQKEDFHANPFAKTWLKPRKKQKAIQKPLSVVSWPQLFKIQNQEGFWQLNPELGNLLNLDVDLIHVSLAKNGIQSLGPKGKEKLSQLIATLLVLEIIRYWKLEGLIFKSLMQLGDSPESWALTLVKKAVEWARRTDRQFPSICQRLELGKDWDSATKKLLCLV